MNSRSLLVLVVILGTTGCASVPRDAPHFARAPAAPDGYATVYLYRLGAFPKLRRPTVSLDGTRVYDPPERALTWVYVRAGAHSVYIHWSWDTGSPDLSLPQRFSSGQSYYIRISGSVALVPTPMFLGSRSDSIAQFIPPAEAETEMANCCRFLQPYVKQID